MVATVGQITYESLCLRGLIRTVPPTSPVSAGNFGPMTGKPLPFDPIARAAELWRERIGPAMCMAAVTGVMRVQQIIQSAWTPR